MKKIILFLILVSPFILPSFACSPTTLGSPSPLLGPITVGSKIDTEGSLLAQLIIIKMGSAGFNMIDKSQLGATNVVRQALLTGEIDMYPEYTGNGAFFFPNSDPTVWNNAQKGYETVAALDKQANNIIWLQPAPANNTWAIAVTQVLADKENLKSMEDFAAYVNRDGTVKLAASTEFITSPVALPAFQKVYGFTLQTDQLVQLSGGNTALTEKAAAEGIDGVNAAMAYGTDGSLSALHLVVLTDPKGAQPVYEPAPIVRGIVYDRYPQMKDLLDPVFQSLDLQTLQTLNAQIALEGQPAENVVRNYMINKGFLIAPFTVP